MSSFIFSVVLPILTLVFAVIAAVYAYRGDRRKSGTKISGMASWVSSFDAEDVYMGTVTLQNLKDRAVVIYAIYLEIGHGHFLDLEDRSGDPLILKPFGVYYQQYEPVDFYASNLTRVRLDDALRNRKTRASHRPIHRYGSLHNTELHQPMVPDPSWLQKPVHSMVPAVPVTV